MNYKPSLEYCSTDIVGRGVIPALVITAAQMAELPAFTRYVEFDPATSDIGPLKVKAAIDAYGAFWLERNLVQPDTNEFPRQPTLRERRFDEDALFIVADEEFATQYIEQIRFAFGLRALEVAA